MDIPTAENPVCIPSEGYSSLSASVTAKNLSTKTYWYKYILAINKINPSAQPVFKNNGPPGNKSPHMQLALDCSRGFRCQAQLFTGPFLCRDGQLSHCGRYPPQIGRPFNRYYEPGSVHDGAPTRIRLETGRHVLQTAIRVHPIASLVHTKKFANVSNHICGQTEST